MQRRTLRSILGPFVLAFSGGCTLLLVPPPGEVQCVQASQCTTLLGEEATCTDGFCAKLPRQVIPVDPQIQDETRWRCVGGTQWPSRDTSRLVTTRFRIIDKNQAPISNCHIRVCERFDPTCQAPLSDAYSNTEGYVDAKIFQGFDGYFEIIGPDGRIDESSLFKPMIRLAEPILDEERGASLTIPIEDATTMIRRTEFDAAQKFLRVSQHTGYGFLAVRVVDCDHKRADGVSLRLEPTDGETTAFYSVNGFPSISGGPTSPSGEGGFYNAPSGFSTLTAVYTRYDAAIGKRAILLRSDWMTVAEFAPTP